MSEDPAPASAVDACRVFLVVVDETEEMRNALRYACRRAQHTSGRVALLYAIEPVEFQHWLGVGRVMEEDARAEAELRMQTLAAEVFAQTGSMPAIHIREGQRTEQLVASAAGGPDHLAAGTGHRARWRQPGALVTFLLSHLGRRVRIPVTLVPGELTIEEIDALS